MNFKLASCICIALTLVFLSDADLLARGMGGGRGGGARGGMSRGGASMSRGGAGMSRGGASRSRGGVSASRSSAGASRGGVTSSGRATAGQRGTKSASGPRGGSVTVGGARGGVKGPSGGAAGRAGGVQVTGPGGRTATKGGAQAGARGPGGAVGGQARGRSVGGSRGSATGRQTRTAGRSVSTDAGFSKYRGGVSVRGGSRRSTAHRTRSVTATTRRTHGTAVRRNTNVRYRNRRSWYGRSWYARYPNAWRATRLSTAAIWSAASWNSVASYFGSTDATEPVYYDYGNTIVYEGDTVYNGTEQVASAEEYYQEASEIADAGSTEVDDDDDWMSLGVWAMVKGDEEESNNIIQLAVNKDGLIRGNHYNALKDETTPIQGSVNKETQRAAWTIGDNSKVISETGIYNLTQDETDMLIHYGSDKTQQWSLVRLESPETEGIAE